MQNLLLVTLCVTSLLAFSQNDLNTSTTIPWSNNLNLEWPNFKANPNLNVVAFAQTTYKIEIFPNEVQVDENNTIKNYQSLHVNALFYSDESWVYKESDFLLKYEQLHFDIAGLFALKINEEFKTLIDQNEANFDAYYTIYKRLWKDCLDTQKQYDSETNHGQNIEENQIWIDQISKEIKSHLD